MWGSEQKAKRSKAETLSFENAFIVTSSSERRMQEVKDDNKTQEHISK